MNTNDTRQRSTPTLTRSTALRFVILLGIVSLFADMTYEGARSVTGPFLGIMGANATTVGLVIGFGELVGYALRLVAGYVSDRTRQYWALTLAGYGLNLLAVPLLALAGAWQIAALLIITERLGKAIRTPARDKMLSHATNVIGHGRGFGLHEAMDQIGAVLGPLLVAVVLGLSGSYQSGFAILLLPALLAFSFLILARARYPQPRDFEPAAPPLETEGLPQAFWFYLAAVAFIALGFADFPLIAFHFQKEAMLAPDMIPVVYAVAMGVDALAALIFGHWFDRAGITALMAATLLSSVFAPLAFLGSTAMAIAGVVLWGIGMGAQESIMRAAIAEMVPADRRGSAYGLFTAGFGLFWFAGSGLMGILYDHAILYLVVFSVVAQFLALPFLWWTERMLAGLAQ